MYVSILENSASERKKIMELATYATRPEDSRGRLYPDFPNINRSPFQRDRDRLIHSAAFRRLDGKTQVFAYHEGKNYRTRLTHSIEVSQITRTLCKSLGLNEELGEAVALAHDLGHSPFGHAGERALQNAMAKFGGFDHNINSLRIMTRLEAHYPEFPGLNLTWETIEATVKHNGPIKKINSPYLKEFNKTFNLDLKNFPSLEGQVGGIADDIAYNNHDIDDGYRGGFFTIDQLRRLPFLDEIITGFLKKYPDCDDKGELIIYGITRSLISRMIFDVMENTAQNLQKLNIKKAADARRQKQFVVDFSPKMKQEIKQLRAFLKENFYTSTPVARMDMKSQKLVEELFALFMNDPRLLPPEWRRKVSAGSTDAAVAETVCDYIANMTDAMALEEHRRLFDPHFRF